jgi:GNAT superfamily N-acetyltransferase
MSDLIVQALDVNAANMTLGCERFEGENAIFVRNREAPDIYDANHVRNVTASTQEEIDRLLARAEREYAGIGHRRFDVDFRTPPAFVARLALEGYERSDALVMLLEGGLAGAAAEHDIRAIRSEADWQAYAALHAVDWREYREKVKQPEQPEIGERMWGVNRRQQPPVQYWIAYVEGKPAAYFNSWAGIGGVGQVENLFTHPDFRHRGLATALIHHCVADCRRKGAGPIVITADPTDTPKNRYATMGFRPVAIYSHYLKKLTFTP